MQEILTLKHQVEENQAKMQAEGYTQVNGADRRLQIIEKMAILANKRFNAKHDVLWNLVSVEDTQMSWDFNKNAAIPVRGLWCPTWLLTLAECHVKWHDDARSGRAKPSDYDDLVETLHKGLAGDMESVWSFIGLLELAREATSFFKPSPKVQTYSSLNELRELAGLDPLEDFK